MADENKKLLGLLNGIARLYYYGEEDITEAYLKEQLYEDVSLDEFNCMLTKTRNNVKSMAAADMDMAQLEAFLTSRIKKKDGGITESAARVYGKFWKNHRARIHESLVKKCQWNSRLESFNWRVDMKSQSRTETNIASPTALLELKLKHPMTQENNKKSEVVQFEMDEKGLDLMIKELKDIECQLTKHSAA